MVSVLIKLKVTGKLIYKCGGSLIHPGVVLTVAHCVDNIARERIMIRAGQWDLSIKNETIPHQDRFIEEIIFHPEYNRSRLSLHNDIALLIMAEPIRLAENVNVICLPDENTAFDRSQCVVTGWGKNNPGRTGKYSQKLKKIDLSIVASGQCQRRLQQTRLGRQYKLHKSFICAGGLPGKDACTGDGGSPLICPIIGTSSQYYQVGIVAMGIGCGNNIPGILLHSIRFLEN